MSRYDEMLTDKLIAIPPGEVALDHGNALAWAAAMRDRLAAYERVVAALHAMTPHQGLGGSWYCPVCNRPIDLHQPADPPAHRLGCLWLLAQQVTP